MDKVNIVTGIFQSNDKDKDKDKLLKANLKSDKRNDKKNAKKEDAKTESKKAAAPPLQKKKSLLNLGAKSMDSVRGNVKGSGKGQKDKKQKDKINKSNEDDFDPKDHIDKDHKDHKAHRDDNDHRHDRDHKGDHNRDRETKSKAEPKEHKTHGKDKDHHKDHFKDQLMTAKRHKEGKVKSGKDVKKDPKKKGSLEDTGSECGDLPPKKRERVEQADKPNDKQKEFINQWVSEQVSQPLSALIHQYDSSIKGTPAKVLEVSANRVAFEAHKDKNRYHDIVCAEPSRVHLKDGREGDYIHANYIKMESLLNTFICTQAPMHHTIIDFWRMLVQEKVRHVFMLCEAYEDGRKKCEKYWPADVGQMLTFGDFVILTTHVKKIDHHVITCTMDVMDKKDGKRWIVQQHNWLTWPDKSAPKSLLAVFRLLKYARTSRYDVSVVHCSAGIGRTGTFVAVECVLMSLLDLRKVDLPKMVKEIRELRCNSVQVDVQYLFIVAAIGKYASNMHCLTPDTEAKYKLWLGDYEEHVVKRAKDMQTVLALKAQAAQHQLDIAGGKNCPTLPPGARPEDFPQPEGAGTGFQLDMGTPHTPTAMENAGTPQPPNGAQPKLEINDGDNFATLPPGAKTGTFPTPDAAGTGFQIDLSIPKVVKPPPTGRFNDMPQKKVEPMVHSLYMA